MMVSHCLNGLWPPHCFPSQTWSSNDDKELLNKTPSPRTPTRPSGIEVAVKVENVARWTCPLFLFFGQGLKCWSTWLVCMQVRQEFRGRQTFRIKWALPFPLILLKLYEKNIGANYTWAQKCMNFKFCPAALCLVATTLIQWRANLLQLQHLSHPKLMPPT